MQTEKLQWKNYEGEIQRSFRVGLLTVVKKRGNLLRDEGRPLASSSISVNYLDELSGMKTTAWSDRAV